MKIILTCLVKDDTEHERFEQMLSSFMPYCTGLAVVITSEKNKKIVELVKKHKGKYVIATSTSHPQLFSTDSKGTFFSNFAEARNLSFELADTMEADWYTWADCDDILVGGDELVKVAEQAKSVDCVFFTYWYSLEIKNGQFDQNSVQIEHARERLLKPKVFKWVSRLHEVAVSKDQNYQPVITQYEYSDTQRCVWAHLTDSERAGGNMQRNIRILELQAKEEEHKDPRTLFYLAKTYYDMKKKELDELALFLLQEYREKSGWNEERANSWQYTAQIHGRRGNHKEAVQALLNGIAEYPNNHMLILLLSKEYSELGHHEFSDFWLEVAVRMDPPKVKTTIGNPQEVKFLAASLKYNQAIRKLDIDESIKWLKVRGQIGGLKEEGMLKTLEDAKLFNQAGIWFFNYAKWLKEKGFEDKIPSLLEAVPDELGQEAFIMSIANEYKKPKKWGGKSIVYFASWGAKHFEKWSPKNLGSGIGGSETAVIELSRAWAKLGFDVTVYGDPKEDAGIYEGVIYRPWYECNWNDEFNILILWRSPHLLDRDIKAKKIWYDAHDVESNLNWTPERVEKIDKVFFKSKYHRSQVPNLPNDKVAVISNGI